MENTNHIRMLEFGCIRVASDDIKTEVLVQTKDALIELEQNAQHALLKTCLRGCWTNIDTELERRRLVKTGEIEEYEDY